MNKNVLNEGMEKFILNRTIEYNDNRLRKFIAQYEKCVVTGTELVIGTVTI